MIPVETLPPEDEAFYRPRLSVWGEKFTAYKRVGSLIWARDDAGGKEAFLYSDWTQWPFAPAETSAPGAESRGNVT